MNDGENEQIPYSAKVLETGVVPKPRKNASHAIDKVGMWDAMWEENSQNSIWSSFWRWGHLMGKRGFGLKRSPAGWSPADNIHGIFENYREYLEKSKTPEELMLRKQYVVQRINYERKMAHASTATKVGSFFLSQAMDPFTYLFGAGIGGATKGIASGMARAGAGRISSSIVHGAATGALFDAAYTTTKKVLAADVDNPEYHILGGALWGGTFGAVGGMISESAGLARFKIEHGASDYKTFRSYDRAKRKLWSGGYDGLDAKDQLILSSALEEQVDGYLASDLAAAKYRRFNIDLENISRDSKVSTVGKFLGTPVNLGAKALNWMKGKFSNQLTLLTSDLDTLRVAGMKIFPTSTYERRLASAVGNEEPLVTAVASKNARAERSLFMAFREGYKSARKDSISKDIYNDRLFNALSSKTAYENETNGAIRKAANDIGATLHDAAKDLHSVGGFQWQKDARDAYHATRDSILAMVKKLRPEDTESAKLFHDSLTLATEKYAYSLSPASLEDAVERMGGSYFPRHVDGGKVQADRKAAVRALADSHVKSKGEWVRSQLAKNHGELLKNVTAGDPAEAWSQYRKQLMDRGWDIFSEPPDGIIDPSTLHYSEKFLKDAVNLAEARASDAVESSLGTARGYSPRRVKMRNALERSLEDPDTHPRGSARSRSYHDDFDIIKDFLDNDVLSLAKNYVTQMYSDAAMIRSFGDEHGIELHLHGRNRKRQPLPKFPHRQRPRNFHAGSR